MFASVARACSELVEVVVRLVKHEQEGHEFTHADRTVVLI
jgi:hypothetical protein